MEDNNIINYGSINSILQLIAHRLIYNLFACDIPHLLLSLYHRCQVSRFGRDSPDIWPYVPVVSRFAWFCSIVPESSSIAQIGVWHKHKLSILSNFGPYISMFSGHGSTRSPISGCGFPNVGVVAKFSRALCARYIYFLLCPGLSLHKLGNCAIYLAWIASNTVV